MKGLIGKAVAIGDRVNGALVSAHFRMEETIHVAGLSPRKVRIGMTVAMLLMCFAPTVFAQQSLGDSFNTAAQTVDAGKVLAGKIMGAAAVVALLVAGMMMKRRSKEGEGSQVKVGAIFGVFLAGLMLAAGGALLYRAGASLGLQSSDYGQLPGGN